MSTFSELQLPDFLLSALADLGYESPSPVQEQGVPALLTGQDLIVQAQTGTGKTATFALPILSQLNLDILAPQALILAPTRELAIQVAEAFQSYAKYLKPFYVLPIYGGQDYQTQLRSLKRGVHVVVGTPGRVMDHLRRGTLKLDHIRILVLDEADEMLRMGFLEDVEWILKQIPGAHQTALFSATMPSRIEKIANNYLKKPLRVQIKSVAKAVNTIKQYYMVVSRNSRLEMLTRFLEVGDFDAVIVFARTKTMTLELAEKLVARGYAVEALNGDVKQSHRERIIQRIKKGEIDIIIATDVAARGIDIDRISLVINYDIPCDAESYVHRIGRTGRAGREGQALLFVGPRESRALRALEKDIQQNIIPLEMPSIDAVYAKRSQVMIDSIKQTLAARDLAQYKEQVEAWSLSNECSELDIAAALLYLSQKDKAHPEEVDDYDDVSDEPKKHRRSYASKERSGPSRDRSARAPRGRDYEHRDRRERANAPREGESSRRKTSDRREGRASSPFDKPRTEAKKFYEKRKEKRDRQSY